MQFVPTSAGQFDKAGADKQYSRLFTEAGFEIERTTVEKAATRLSARRAVATRLACELTNWARLRRLVRKGTTDNSWQHLLAIANTIDTDPWRKRLRLAWKNTGKAGVAQVRELAKSAELKSLPPSSIVMLGYMVRDRMSAADAAALLHRAQRHHVSDYDVNLTLALFFATSTPARLDEAITFNRVALALRPRSYPACFNLGVALAKKGDLDEAIDHFRTSITLHPTPGSALANLGVALMRKGKQREAVECFQRAIKLKSNSGSASSHYNLGAFLLKQGNHGEAIAHFKTAIALNPTFAKAHNTLGAALARQGKWSEAESSIQRAIEIDPKRSDYHFNLGIALANQKKREEAIRAYARVIELDQLHALAYINLFKSLHLLDRKDEAKKVIDKLADVLLDIPPQRLKKIRPQMLTLLHALRQKKKRPPSAPPQSEAPD